MKKNYQRPLTMVVGLGLSDDIAELVFGGSKETVDDKEQLAPPNKGLLWDDEIPEQKNYWDNDEE